MEEYKEKALELFETNLNRFFNAELSDIKNRGTTKANTIFWITVIIIECKQESVDFWKKVLKEVEQIRI